MKQLLLATAFAVMAINTSAAQGLNDGVTVDGHTFCRTEELFDELMGAVTARDLEHFEALRNGRDCVTVRGGLRARLEDSIGFFGATIRIRIFTAGNPRGMVMYGPREGFRRGR